MKTLINVVIISSILGLITLAYSIFLVASSNKHTVHGKDYQLDIQNDTVYVYDNSRLVGKCAWDSDYTLEDVIANDNL